MRRLIPALTRWLQNPVIKITPSDEVTGLRAEVQKLREEKDRLKAELSRVERLYWNECTVNMRLSDDNRDLKDQIRRANR